MRVEIDINDKKNAGVVADEKVTDVIQLGFVVRCNVNDNWYQEYAKECMVENKKDHQ